MIVNRVRSGLDDLKDIEGIDPAFSRGSGRSDEPFFFVETNRAVSDAFLFGRVADNIGSGGMCEIPTDGLRKTPGAHYRMADYHFPIIFVKNFSKKFSTGERQFISLPPSG